MNFINLINTDKLKEEFKVDLSKYVISERDYEILQSMKSEYGILECTERESISFSVESLSLPGSDKFINIFRKHFEPIKKMVNKAVGDNYLLIHEQTLDELKKNGLTNDVYLYPEDYFNMHRAIFDLFLKDKNLTHMEVSVIRLPRGLSPDKDWRYKGPFDLNDLKSAVIYDVKKVKNSKHPILVYKTFNSKARKELLAFY